MKYRRAYVKGGMFFFTVVTYQRRRIFSNPHAVDLLRQSFRAVMEENPFKMDAIVILPDHIHCIWTLPKGDSDFSNRWRVIKGSFSKAYRLRDGSLKSASRMRKGEREIWQRRFWEHLVRDETDLDRHMDYIHYNPVKHGLVKSPKDWPYSSFHRCVQGGIYDENWGSASRPDFGEEIGKE